MFEEKGEKCEVASLTHLLKEEFDEVKESVVFIERPEQRRHSKDYISVSRKSGLSGRGPSGYQSFED